MMLAFQLTQCLLFPAERQNKKIGGIEPMKKVVYSISKLNKFGSNLLFLQVTMFVMADKHENTFKQSLSRDVSEET